MPYSVLVEHRQRKYKARIVGPISIPDDKGQTTIPLGECRVVEEHMTGPFHIIWFEGQEERTARLNLREWAKHVSSGAIKVADEPDTL